jgi:hypothetical protein
MKKYILALGLGLCAAAGAMAQGTLISIDNETLEQTRYPIFTFGPEIGLQMSNWSAFDNGGEFSGAVKPGLRAGVVADLALNDVVSLQSGVLFSRKAYITDQQLNRVISRIHYVDQSHSYLTINYFEIPLTLQYKFDVGPVKGLFAGMGFYTGIAFGGDVETRMRRYKENTGVLVEASTIERDLLVGRERGDDVTSLDIGLNVNAGYMVTDKTFVRAHTGIGLKNLAARANSMNALRNFSFGLTVGYLF